MRRFSPAPVNAPAFADRTSSPFRSGFPDGGGWGVGGGCGRGRRVGEGGVPHGGPAAASCSHKVVFAAVAVSRMCGQSILAEAGLAGQQDVGVGIKQRVEH